MPSEPTTVEKYLGNLPEDLREALERLRVDPQACSVDYRSKSTRPESGEQTFEATEFLAR